MSTECTKKDSTYVYPSLDLLNPVEKTESNRFDSTVKVICCFILLEQTILHACRVLLLVMRNCAE